LRHDSPNLNFTKKTSLSGAIASFDFTWDFLDEAFSVYSGSKEMLTNRFLMFNIGVGWNCSPQGRLPSRHYLYDLHIISLREFRSKDGFPSLQLFLLRKLKVPCYREEAQLSMVMNICKKLICFLIWLTMQIKKIVFFLPKIQF
jgi:hypothetical protein